MGLEEHAEYLSREQRCYIHCKRLLDGLYIWEGQSNWPNEGSGVAQSATAFGVSVLVHMSVSAKETEERQGGKSNDELK